MRIAELKQTVVIPEGVTASVAHNTVTVKGKHGEVSRSWKEPKMNVVLTNNTIVISAKNATKKQKRAINTMKSQVKNIIAGVKDGNEYKLKICASHFPMQVAMEGQTIIVKNYFGEKIPRKTTLSKDCVVKVQGDKISVTGPDVEKVGQTAGKIEAVCRITNRDRRRFQDGIFLIERNGTGI